MLEYTPPRLEMMKLIARKTALWHGSYDNDALRVVRSYAFSSADSLMVGLEEFPLADTLAITIADLMAREPARAARLFGEIGKIVLPVDGSLFRALVYSIHQRTNLLSFSRYLSGNLDERYFLSSVIMLMPRQFYESVSMPIISQVNKVPHAEYLEKNRVLQDDINKALQSLKCSPVESLQDRAQFQKDVASSVFGPVWAELYVSSLLHVSDIIKEVLQQRPAFWKQE